MAHGTFGWNELMSSDIEASKDFYKRVAGWKDDLKQNDPATQLYLRAGFREVSRRPNYYGDATALVLRRDLVSPMDSNNSRSI